MALSVAVLPWFLNVRAILTRAMKLGTVFFQS